MREGLPDGSAISNKSLIYFDSNEPIATNTWLNTLDRNLPSSQVLEASKTSDTTALLRITGSDPSAGVRYFLLYASDNGGPYYYAGRVSGDTITVEGEIDHTYRFFARAVDSVGNEEMKGPAAEAMVTFDNPLPVTLTRFEARAIGAQNQLNWITATEINSKGFYVQKSTDGLRFADIAFVASQAVNGNSNEPLFYQLADNNPQPLSYYRLKQVDIDGRFAFSNTVLVSRDVETQFTVSPNPARSSFMIQTSKNIQSIRLMDMTGRTLRQYNPMPGATYRLPTIAPGTYLLQVVIEGKMIVERLIIQ